PAPPCPLSLHDALPIFGRLVLRIAGHHGEHLERSSDAMCTALQLTNFWQDFGRDWRAGRLYVPRDVVVACRAREMELDAPWLTEDRKSTRMNSSHGSIS